MVFVHMEERKIRVADKHPFSVSCQSLVFQKESKKQDMGRAVIFQTKPSF